MSARGANGYKQHLKVPLYPIVTSWSIVRSYRCSSHRDQWIERCVCHNTNHRSGLQLIANVSYEYNRGCVESFDLGSETSEFRSAKKCKPRVIIVLRKAALDVKRLRRVPAFTTRATLQVILPVLRLVEFLTLYLLLNSNKYDVSG